MCLDADQAKTDDHAVVVVVKLGDWDDALLFEDHVHHSSPAEARGVPTRWIQTKTGPQFWTIQHDARLATKVTYFVHPLRCRHHVRNVPRRIHGEIARYMEKPLDQTENQTPLSKLLNPQFQINDFLAWNCAACV